MKGNPTHIKDIFAIIAEIEMLGVMLSELH